MHLKFLVLSCYSPHRDFRNLNRCKQSWHDISLTKILQSATHDISPVGNPKTLQILHHQPNDISAVCSQARTHVSQALPPSLTEPGLKPAPNCTRTQPPQLLRRAPPPRSACVLPSRSQHRPTHRPAPLAPKASVPHASPTRAVSSALPGGAMPLALNPAPAPHPAPAASATK